MITTLVLLIAGVGLALYAIHELTPATWNVSADVVSSCRPLTFSDQ